MPIRPRRSGRGTTIRRSKRPGRSSAGSSTSGRFVAAMMITPSLLSKPSISTRSWLSVCSRSSWPPPRPAPRWRPTASISSMKMMHGAFFLPCSNRSRTRLAPTPTNISTKSEPEIEKNGTPASPAMARASSVLPVPGGPIIRTPFGIRPPRRGELLRILEEGDDLLDLVLRFLDTGDVLERHAVLVIAEQLRLGLAKAHRLAAATLQLAHEQEEDADEEQHRQPPHEHLRPDARLF